MLTTHRIDPRCTYPPPHASALLGVRDEDLTRARLAGEIRTHRLAGQVVIYGQELLDWARRGAPTGAARPGGRR